MERDYDFRNAYVARSKAEIPDVGKPRGALKTWADALWALHDCLDKN